MHEYEVLAVGARKCGLHIFNLPFLVKVTWFTGVTACVPVIESAGGISRQSADTTWSVRCQTSGDLPSFRASPP